jgi:hypothetical protein
MAEIREPIILLGAARSGTGMLGSALSRHPDVAFLDEPNFIWRAYNADLGHDMIPATRATEKVKRYIHARFDELRAAQGSKSRILEKTPQSTIRLPFVLEVFPDARLVHVIRDGRQVVASAIRKAHGDVRKVTRSAGGVKRRRGNVRNAGMLSRVLLDKWQTGFPRSDLPHYLRKIWDTSAGILGMKRVFAWGPEFPGMRQMVNTHPIVDIYARQWQICVDGVRNVLASRPGLPVYEVRFERLVGDVDGVTREIFDFAGLPQPDTLPKMASNTFDGSIDLFERDLDAAAKRMVYDRIGRTLQDLGYWKPEDSPFE